MGAFEGVGKDALGSHRRLYRPRHVIKRRRFLNAGLRSLHRNARTKASYDTPLQATLGTGACEGTIECKGRNWQKQSQKRYFMSRISGSPSMELRFLPKPRGPNATRAHLERRPEEVIVWKSRSAGPECPLLAGSPVVSGELQAMC